MIRQVWIAAAIAFGLALLGFAAWVRLAPDDPARWHVLPGELPSADTQGLNSFLAVRPLTRPGPEALAGAEGVILAAPRTTRIAGSPAEGMVTYVTRSRVWGFPDYTTLRASDGVLVVWGRARYGQSDLGVNRARIEGWLAALADRI